MTVDEPQASITLLLGKIHAIALQLTDDMDPKSTDQNAIQTYIALGQAHEILQDNEAAAIGLINAAFSYAEMLDESNPTEAKRQRFRSLLSALKTIQSAIRVVERVLAVTAVGSDALTRREVGEVLELHENTIARWVKEFNTMIIQQAPDTRNNLPEQWTKKND